MSELEDFNELFSNYHPRFVRFANSYVRDTEVAEDFTMEAFMAYWENRRTLKADSNIPAYILTVIRNKCLNHLQQKKIREEIISQMSNLARWELDMNIKSLSACNPDELFSVEAQKLIDNALQALPERTKEIFLLSRFQNKSYNEIANIYGISVKGVEFHVSKALKILRIALKDYLSVFLYFFV